MESIETITKTIRMNSLLHERLLLLIHDERDRLTSEEIQGETVSPIDRSAIEREIEHTNQTIASWLTAARFGLRAESVPVNERKELIQAVQELRARVQETLGAVAGSIGSLTDERNRIAGKVRMLDKGRRALTSYANATVSGLSR